MTTYDFTIKRRDTLPIIQATLKDKTTNQPIDISGATVRFHMFPVGSTTPKIDASATIISSTAGTVKYVWSTVNTDTAGVYNAEWEVTFGNGDTQTFPNNEYNSVYIKPDLV